MSPIPAGARVTSATSYFGLEAFVEVTQNHFARFATEAKGHEALRELLDAGSSDATRVGRMVLDLHAQQETLRAAHQSDIAALKELLTVDQADKLDAMLVARSFGSRFGERRHHGRFGRQSRRPGEEPQDSN